MERSPWADLPRLFLHRISYPLDLLVSSLQLGKAQLWALGCSIMTAFIQSEQLRSGERLVFGCFTCLFVWNQKSFLQREDGEWLFSGLEADVIVGWGQGKEVVSVAHRIRDTQNGDRRVKGCYRCLCSVVNQLLSTLKAQTGVRELTEGGRNSALLSWVIKNLAGVRSFWVEFSPFTQTQGKMLKSACTSQQPSKLFLTWSFLVISDFCMQQAEGSSGPAEQLWRWHWCAVRLIPAGAVSVETQNWPGQLSCQLGGDWGGNIQGTFCGWKTPYFLCYPNNTYLGFRACTLHGHQLSSTDFAAQDCVLVM